MKKSYLIIAALGATAVFLYASGKFSKDIEETVKTETNKVVEEVSMQTTEKSMSPAVTTNSMSTDEKQETYENNNNSTQVSSNNQDVQKIPTHISTPVSSTNQIEETQGMSDIHDKTTSTKNTDNNNDNTLQTEQNINRNLDNPSIKNNQKVQTQPAHYSSSKKDDEPNNNVITSDNTDVETDNIDETTSSDNYQGTDIENVQQENVQNNAETEETINHDIDEKKKSQVQ